MLELLTLTLFCLENTSLRKKYFNNLAVFSVGFLVEIRCGHIFTSPFHCVNSCLVSRDKFKHSA